MAADLVEHLCGCIDYDYGPPLRCEEHAGACEHPTWEPTLTVWPGETFERMTKTCILCGHIRGRAGKHG